MTLALAQHRNNMQQQKSFIGRILSSSLDVDLTEGQIGQNGPKIDFFSHGTVATVCM